MAVLDLPCCAQAFSNSNAWTSRCIGFSYCGEQALELGLSSCGTQHVEQSSRTRDQICVPCTVRQVLSSSTTAEVILKKRERQRESEREREREALQSVSCGAWELQFSLWVVRSLVVAHELSCSMWGLVPWPVIKPWPATLGTWSLSLWTTRKSLV